ncbi:efflux RND transporter periplasmic adaptor subunit [Prochlorococcus sp. MIT 1307]|uniref:efflux RND transporter periplasmic adaptor subunit n=1 Tax=Prochlorococcus sp. MIT 1307 TaxID=3096219 RepID=UPI002A7503E4|nr:efflux RND transporter periplasmic adaptor subunit [Prochlorococcus sp. MIT 1307]
MARTDQSTENTNPTKGSTLLRKVKSLDPNRKSWVGLLSFLILISSGGVAWKLGPGQNRSRDVNDYTVKAESGSLPRLITSSGELKAERSVNVSPERRGLLEDLFVKEGERVSKGQLIARMKSGDYLYRLNELKAEYEKQRASYERRKNLFVQGAISEEDHDEYRNKFLTSQARLKQREVEGDELSILAPFDGVITTRYAEPGAFVTPTTRASSNAGSTSTSIVELSQGLEVIAKVPESDIGRIRVNQVASVRVDAFPDQRFKAKVSEIAPRAVKTNNVTSFEVTLLLVNPSKKLRIGMTVDIEFQSNETAISTLVPTVAIVTENGTPGVLIVDQKKQPLFQKVELGISSGSRTAIIKGINPGDRVFIDLPPWAKRRRD